ncbi:hypothetical protein [Nocardia brasiliensis]|uniref:hypothetical protein n=1 Tax=Nocardia brasiliensis TaxID=37326 RepID=UPI0011DC7398|nr:hypothetical protein [Nocardia brasiliensis]
MLPSADVVGIVAQRARPRRARRYLSVATLLALCIGLLVVPTVFASADSLPTAPKLCTAEEEKSGDAETIDSCQRRRLDSAIARYDALPESAKFSPFEVKGDMKAPSKPRDAQSAANPRLYEAWAKDVNFSVCRYVAMNGGELCGYEECASGDNVLKSGLCDALSGGYPEDGKQHDDDKLPEDLLDLKTTTEDVVFAAGAVDTSGSSAESRIAANTAEAAAVAAQRALGWLS